MGLSGLLLSPLGHADAGAQLGALELGAISIEDSAIDADDATQQLGYTVRGSTSSTGLALTPRQTPQSVTTITRQQMNDRGITNIEQALEVTPGVSASKYEVGGRTDFRARGYKITNWKVDGLQYSGDSGFSGAGNSMNMDMYERVDIVRGANGLLGGTGDPSATVDLIRKRPGKDFGGSAYLTYGSWDKTRLGADLNVPLSEDGRLRSRFVITQEDANSFRDHQSERARAALANVEFDLSDDTTLGAGYQYEYSKTVGGGWGANIPIWYADGSKTDLSRSTNLVPSWSHGENQTRTAFASLSHRFNEDWKLDVQAAQSTTEALNHYGLAKVNQFSRGVYTGYPEQDGSGMVLNGLHSSSDTTQQSAQFDLSGAFQLLGRSHQAMFGYSDSRTVGWTPEYSCTMSSATRTTAPALGCQFRSNNGLPLTDWHNGVDDDLYMTASETGRHGKSVTRLQGMYAATRLSITDPLSVILGVRASDYHTKNATAAGVRSSQTESGVVTPYVGAVYDLNDNYSLYASYTDLFTPQSEQTTSGNRVEPIVGQSYETGIKGEWFDGRLNAQVAYFRTKQDNKAVTDGANQTPSETQAYVAGSGTETDGIDVELAGAITPNWNVYGGYTYLHFRRLDSDGRSDPSHLFKASTTYRLSGPLDRLTLGTGVSAQSNIRALSSPAGVPTAGVSRSSTEVNWSGYAIWNAMARYDINDDTDVSLNVNNLFDKTYYTRYGFYAGAIYGDPRSMSVTLRTQF
ncbi:TonB-dependent siderophore receptor [Pseudomonas sp. MM211]|uniref:TonB-dependent siderophore receptor n=1 Tax=Pseudomonas sp. MM211 TaxID=2866808 RepID=UPI003FA69267